MSNNLIEPLPANVEVEIPKSESIELALKGTNKEWLVCTNAKLYIIKKGFMTGHTFGGGVYQMPYQNITGVQTDYHVLSGYFQASTGGMQDQPKNYWASGSNSPQKSPNCITITGKPLLEKFRSACDFINQKISDSHLPAAPALDPVDQIKKLADLRDQGILTDDEFSAKKKQLLKI
ncbi:MAG: SHOCT domain-containing protein [Ethanoligenens sp.]